MLDHPAHVGRGVDFLGTISDANQLADEIAEPLAESAPVAFAAAMSGCQDDGNAPSCRAYHAVWQYLRLTGVIRAVRADGPLYAAAVRAQAERGPLRRILVSGTADYSMLAYLGHAAAAIGVSPEFDVVDKCSTSLELNAWYGARRGLSVRTIQSDVLTYEPVHAYDLICTHSFLYWIPSDERGTLLKNWRQWLSPQGRLCTSNRADLPHSVPDPAGSHSRVEAMVSEFFATGRDMGLALPVSDSAFERLIRSYAELRIHRHRDLTMERLLAEFADAGLHLECSLPVAQVVPGNADRISSVASSKGRPRMWFQARRA